MARTEMLSRLAEAEELLKRLPDLELARDEPLPLRRNNFIVGIEEMPVRFAPR